MNNFTTPLAIRHIMCCVDEAGMLIQVSNQWLAKLGYQREDVVGWNFTEFLTPESAVHANRIFYSELQQTGKCRGMLLRFIKKSGEPMDSVLNAVAEMHDDGSHNITVILITDIAQRSQERGRGRDILKSGLKISGVLGDNGCFKKINPTIERITGHTPEEMVVRPFLSLIHPADRAQTQEAIEELALGVNDVSFENRILCKNGQYQWLEWNATVSCEGVQVHIRDITVFKDLMSVLPAAGIQQLYAA